MPRDLRLSLSTAPVEPGRGALVLHGGAGGRVEELSLEARADYGTALAAAHAAGQDVLDAGGSALDAVCATVCALEDDPLFNAGRGASLTATGHAELDASVMTGEGAAGAVAVSRHARHPVLLARAVMERSEHVLLVDPPRGLAADWGLETVPPEHFVTPARRAQLERVLAAREAPLRHGTVGAVAVDAAGRIAAATSTGGIVGQAEGRVGDSPVIGAGTYASACGPRGGVGVSCTGEGEAFLRAVAAHDIAARVRYRGDDLETAVAGMIREELIARDASGGVIAIDAGRVVVAHCSPAMFAAYRDGERLVTLT